MTSDKPDFGAAERRVVLIGGSNTMLSGGWATRLAETAPAGLVVENRAIGAVTTLTGCYRLLAGAPLRPGDVVIWEYGVNEFNFWRGGMPLEVLKHHLRWFIKLCIERQVALIPLIMLNRGQRVGDAYSRQVRAIFAEFGLDVVDCWTIRRSLWFRFTRTARLYRDRAHYAPNTRFIRRIVREVWRRVPRAAPLSADLLAKLDDLAHSRLAIRIPEKMDGSVVFENRAICCRLWPFGPATSMANTGKPLGAIVMATPQGMGFRLMHNADLVERFSTQHPGGAGRPKILVKQICFATAALQDRLAVPGLLQFLPIQRLDQPRVVQSSYYWNPERARPNGRDGLIAIMVEETLDLADPATT